MSPTKSLAITIALLLSASVCPASAGDAKAQMACFPPATLASVAGEEKAVWGFHTFDRPLKLGDFKPASAVPNAMRGAIRRVHLPHGEKVIALTFDLCEQRGEKSGYDGRIFDYLRQQGVKATFFAGGKWIESHPDRIEQLMLDPLFEIGNHTETHQNLRLLTPNVAQQEIWAPQKSYADARARLATKQCVASAPNAIDAVPALPGLFRFPYGACNDATLKAVNDAGMLVIQWDVATGDPNPHESATTIAGAMIREAKPGSIIVNHANGRGWHTAEALPLAIPKLKAQGFKFVTVSELLALGKPDIVQECYDRKPGDTNRYDFLSNLNHSLSSAAPQQQTPTTTVAPAIPKPPPVEKPLGGLD
jgi:peptidoglycan-N-acetylglucosamine deacetylase